MRQKGTYMSSRRLVKSFTLLLLVTGFLTACAAEMRCGFAGCPGDSKISADVRELIDQHPDLRAPNIIHVQTRAHVVYLSGFVSTDLMSEAAATVALGAPGVARVENSIAVTD
jgi:osmotically-inducible protein OsmY